MLVLDSHAHCGLTLPFANIHHLWQAGRIAGGVLISPVEEVYDRYDPWFVDSQEYRESREKVHAYLKSLRSEYIFAYWFVWNDFKPPPGNGFDGVKWHRHSNEPEYQVGLPEYRAFLEQVCSLGLPLMLEDEFQNTLDLVNQINQRIPIIIPHFGGLNGGYQRLKRAGLFEKPNIYVDTALASPHEIVDFAGDYGIDRILFGSDYPFGDPAYERYKVEQIFTGRDREKVLAENLLALLGRKKP